MLQRKPENHFEHRLYLSVSDKFQNIAQQVYIDFHSIYIGMPVKAVWAKERTGSWFDIDYYEAIEDPAIELNKKEQEK